MNDAKDQQGSALGYLATTLAHGVDRLESRRKQAQSESRRRRLRAVTSLTASLAEEVVALAALSGKTLDKDVRAKRSTSLYHDVRFAFRRCLAALELGPTRDYIVRAYLNLSKELHQLEDQH